MINTNWHSRQGEEVGIFFFFFFWGGGGGGGGGKGGEGGKRDRKNSIKKSLKNPQI